MCGTIVQNSGPIDYMEALFANVGNGTGLSHTRQRSTGACVKPLAIHRFGDTPAMDRFHWGYAPRWSKRRPVANAPLDMLLRGSVVWRPLLARRVLVPADGWFEPTDGDGSPYQYIHASDGKPVYIAALTAWRPGHRHGKQDGLAIITDEACGEKDGQARPVILPVSAARLWLDLDTPIIDALQLACTPWAASAYGWRPPAALQ
ncbi:MAG TPA: SOS response-associated peptidase family protein [Bordetella sp.]|nr:SOS response-associated peptidase family protein [Bordetella sp.]